MIYKPWSSRSGTAAALSLSDMKKKLYKIRLSKSVDITDWMTEEMAYKNMRSAIKANHRDASLMVYNSDTANWETVRSEEYDVRSDNRKEVR